MSSALQKLHCQDKLSPPIIARIEQLSEGWKDDIEELHQLVSRNFANVSFAITRTQRP
ncbi:hypothetical protein PILCRDRAFT_14519 [Piloderma croceum F 1598]|uniref:Uncharacterized protein n=1 Tax=Piloderma croceum (strain F 1598) TaxID=765440 RepID=A0A0C3AKE7_PILCF|nr:hypothetical protein PILCRDRAFT_14519 [Piloderma croceum F 1598]